jgi:hypothetical protein
MNVRWLALAVGFSLAVSAQAQKQRLHVFIWSEYIDPLIVEQFEKEFDCKVTLDLYEDNESMMAKLQSGGASLYDICVPSDYIVPVLLKERLLAPLRRENVPNAANLDPGVGTRGSRTASTIPATGTPSPINGAPPASTCARRRERSFRKHGGCSSIRSSSRGRFCCSMTPARRSARRCSTRDTSSTTPTRRNCARPAT